MQSPTPAKTWIKGQSLSSEIKDQSSKKSCCFFSSIPYHHHHHHSTTLVFPSLRQEHQNAKLKPDIKNPFAAHWYSLADLESNRTLRDAVESDILISKMFSSATSSSKSFLLHQEDSQVVFKNDNEQQQRSLTSQDAYLLQVVEFCPGGSLLELVQEHLAQKSKQTQTRKLTLLDRLVLPLSSVCRITHQLLKAVQLLHRNKISHNAISLHNIFLDSENNVRLGNFSKSSSYKTAKPTAALGEKTQNRPSSATRKRSNSTTCHSSSPSPVPVQHNNNKTSSSLCNFCLRPPEEEHVTAAAVASPATPTKQVNHEAKDIFAVGVVCYELLFGCAPTVKAVQNRPETSLAMKLIALREEILGMKKNEEEENEVISKLLICNELLCRFLLLSLSTLPLDRPTSTECVSMFESCGYK